MNMERVLFFVLSLCSIILVMFSGGTNSEDTTQGKRLYPLPAATVGPAMTIESVVIGPFRIWHIVFLCAAGVLVILIIVCCCVDVRIPRTKDEIEESFRKRQLNKKYTKQMASSIAPPSSDTKPGSQPTPQIGIVAKPSQTQQRLPPAHQLKQNAQIERAQQGGAFRYPPTNPRNTSFNSVVEQVRGKRNAPATFEDADHQIRTSANITRSVSNMANNARERARVSAEHSQQNRFARPAPQEVYMNGSAAQENSQNFQRERIRTQQVSRQRQYDPEIQEQRQNQEQIAKMKRFGIQTPLANHPSVILGPQRAAQKASPSLAATARTLVAMNAHPGHLARQKREIAYE